MNLQALGEVAMVCLSAMKLREESYDKEAGRYDLSLRQAAEDAAATAAFGHPPEIQKAMAILAHIMITSWNDAEGWSNDVLRLMLRIPQWTPEQIALQKAAMSIEQYNVTNTQLQPQTPEPSKETPNGTK